MRFMASILEDPNEDDGSLAGEEQSHQQLGDGSRQETPQTPSHLGLTGQVHNRDHQEPVAGMVDNHNQLGTSAPITHEPMQIDPQQQQKQQRRRSLTHHTERQDSASSSSSPGEMLCTDISPDDFTKYLSNKSGNQSRLPQQLQQNHYHQQEHQYTNNAPTAATVAAAAPATFNSSSQWSSHLPELPQREGRISATVPTTTNWSSFGVHDTTDKKGGSNIPNCDPIDNGRTARRSFSLDFTPKRPREEEAMTGTKDVGLGRDLGDYYSELQASLAQTAAAVQREEDAYLHAAGLSLQGRPTVAAVDACTRTNGTSNNTSVEELFHSSLPNLGAASPAITGTGGDQQDMFHNSLPNLGEQRRSGEDRDAKRRRMPTYMLLVFRSRTVLQ